MGWAGSAKTPTLGKVSQITAKSFGAFQIGGIDGFSDSTYSPTSSSTVAFSGRGRSEEIFKRNGLAFNVNKGHCV